MLETSVSVTRKQPFPEIARLLQDGYSLIRPDIEEIFEDCGFKPSSANMFHSTKGRLRFTAETGVDLRLTPVYLKKLGRPPLIYSDASLSIAETDLNEVINELKNGRRPSFKDSATHSDTIAGLPRKVIEEIEGLKEIAKAMGLDLSYTYLGPNQLPHVQMLPKDPSERASVLNQLFGQRR